MKNPRVVIVVGKSLHRNVARQTRDDKARPLFFLAFKRALSISPTKCLHDYPDHYLVLSKGQ